MADFAYDTLKITKIAVWSDNETFGKGVATTSRSASSQRVAQSSSARTTTPRPPPSSRPFLQRAKDAGAQGIYAGATSATKGCIPRGQSKGHHRRPVHGTRRHR